VIGTNDGPIVTAKFFYPTGMAFDSASNLFVADDHNGTIRKITPAGDVSTFAGSPGQNGWADGIGNEALFMFPTGLAIDSSDNIYIGDRGNHTVRKITPSAVVTTLGGAAFQSGTNDGLIGASRFSFPEGVAVDKAGAVYVADRANSMIRKITPDGMVTTFAGNGQQGTNDGVGSTAQFDFATGVAVDAIGNVFVADRGSSTIRKITPDGTVTTYAGRAHEPGSDDGDLSAARFNGAFGLGFDSVGDLFVADYFNCTIRKITRCGTVTTLAGTVGRQGPADGIGSAAGFFFPTSVAFDNAGNLYVTDRRGIRIARGVPHFIQFDSCDTQFANGQFQTRLIGPVGAQVVVEHSPDALNWTPLQTNTLTINGLNVQTMTANPFGFLRANLADGL
jgi:hypothetical protein